MTVIESVIFQFRPFKFFMLSTEESNLYLKLSVTRSQQKADKGKYLPNESNAVINFTDKCECFKKHGYYSEMKYITYIIP